jgi:hypothetical protein
VQILKRHLTPRESRAALFPWIEHDLLSRPCTPEASRELDCWLVAIEADRQRQREGR